MVWRVAVVAAAPGQFVPFRRQTEEPFTWMEEAFNVVPEAVAKPNQPVEVPFVKERLVACAVVAKRLVDVVFVPVALVQVRLVKLDGLVPLTVRFVNVPFVAKRLVEVELVLVVFVKTPVDGVVAPIVVPLIVPPEMVTLEEVKVGAVSEAMVPFKAFTVVPEAVAKPNQLVEVPFTNEMFWRLVVPVTVRFVMNCSSVVPFTTKRLVDVPFVKERFVIVPLVRVPFVAKRLVLVALVDVTFVTMRLPSVVWPVTFNVPVAVRFRVWMPPKA
jgi:hypothetical protein